MSFEERKIRKLQRILSKLNTIDEKFFLKPTSPEWEARTTESSEVKLLNYIERKVQHILNRDAIPVVARESELVPPIQPIHRRYRAKSLSQETVDNPPSAPVERGKHIRKMSYRFSLSNTSLLTTAASSGDNDESTTSSHAISIPDVTKRKVKKKKIAYKFERGFISLESILRYHSKIFIQYAKKTKSEENVKFYIRVNLFNNFLENKEYSKALESFHYIINRFVRQGAEESINISSDVRKELIEKAERIPTEFESKKEAKKYRKILRGIFSEAHEEIYRILHDNIYAGFIETSFYDAIVDSIKQ